MTHKCRPKQLRSSRGPPGHRASLCHWRRLTLRRQLYRFCRSVSVCLATSDRKRPKARDCKPPQAIIGDQMNFIRREEKSTTLRLLQIWALLITAVACVVFKNKFTCQQVCGDCWMPGNGNRRAGYGWAKKRGRGEEETAELEWQRNQRDY